MPLLPKTKSEARESLFIAHCLLAAADDIDRFDNGEEFTPNPCINDFVASEAMAARWMWALLALIDHFDIQTSDVRRLSHVIAQPAQATLWH